MKPNQHIVNFIFRSGLPIIISFLLLLGCSKDPSQKIIENTKEMMGTIATYQFGQSRSWLQDFQDLMIELYNMPEIHDEVEQMMLDFLQSDATVDGKMLISKYLGMIGSAASVPVLKDMLSDPAMSEMARIAMIRIPDPSVEEALRNALSETEGEMRIGIINSLAARGDGQAVDALGPLIYDEDESVAEASIDALGDIAGSEAIDYLYQAFQKLEGPKKWIIADALLKCLEDVGDATIYSEIYHSDAPLSLRYEAFRGLVATSDQQVDLILQYLPSADAAVQESVVTVIRQLPPAEPTEKLIPMLRDLSLPLRLQVFLALADLGESGLRPVALDYLRSSHLPSRLAALEGLRRIGTSQDVMTIVGVAANGDVREREAARLCLYRMKGAEIDDVILSNLDKTKGSVRAELVLAVGSRQLDKGAEQVIGLLSANDPQVRLASIKSVGMIAAPEDLERVIDLTVIDADVDFQDDIKRSITNIANRIPDPEGRVAAIKSKMDELEDADAIVLLIGVLGNLSIEQALNEIRQYKDADNYDVRLACVEALAEWPDAAPMNDLKEILDAEDDDRIHTLAVKGYVQSILKADGMGQDEKAQELITLYPKSVNINEQSMIITGLSRIESIDGLKMLVGLIGEADISSDVEQAVIRVASSLDSRYNSEVRMLMDQAKDLTDSEEFLERIDVLLKAMD